MSYPARAEGENLTNRPVKVHLFGSEENGWALDTDLALSKKSLEGIPDLVQLTSFQEAEVIHSVWEEPLFNVDQRLLEGKRVVCHVCNDFMRLHENACMIKSPDTIGLWVAMSRAAEATLKGLDYPSIYIPYSVDTEVFQPPENKRESTLRLRDHYQIPADVFVISNFMRDSSGSDLGRPKEQKGAELLVEIGVGLRGRGVPVHFLLAGPRRHWIRRKLQEYSVPYTFIGKERTQDDQEIKITRAHIIADLYRASDLHLISSRWEGGPRSVLEAAATKTPILSTPVGIAPDILSDLSIYQSVDEAISKATGHFHYRLLDATLENQFETISRKHTPAANEYLFRKLYQDINFTEPYVVGAKWRIPTETGAPLSSNLITKIKNLFQTKCGTSTLRVSLWHKFHKPPYGGGNQFMMALKSAMQKRGIEVVNNELSRSVDIHICNSCWFDHEKFQSKAHSFPVKMIHRIDGPVTLYRGEGRDEDEMIFNLNRRFASATVFQSAFSFRKSYELGFRAISPVIIHNSVNDDIFNTVGKKPVDGDRKTRLISSAWSDNPRKGGPFLKWLDEHLDWKKYEYTFVGRVKEKFDNIHHIDAVSSEDLSDLLRQHDIYISVSQHEPCSNALLEALSCGLPALYRNDGGNPELVSFGGLPFSDEHDVLSRLSQLVDNFSSFQNLIWVKSIDDIANRYIQLAERICAWEA